MKSITVSQREAFEYDRLDPGFHIAISGHKEKIKELKNQVSAEDATSLVNNVIEEFSVADLEMLHPLTTGSKRVDKKMISLAVERYPHEAMAILNANTDQLIAVVEKKLAEAESMKASAMAVTRRLVM